LIAAERLNDAAMRSDALTALSFIMDRQTAPAGHFRPVPTRVFAAGQTGGTGEGVFDQQPLEAQASIEACLNALRLTGGDVWKTRALTVWSWFHGDNDHGLRLMTEDGGCFDGLTESGLNENQGAESVLAAQLSWCALKHAGL
ncbi:MAG: glycosyl transferase family 1, partial [Asticcacaulis sp.]